MRSHELDQLSGSELAKFTGLVALSAIFFDAALGHGLLWENDPYWTYWVTKTFLIATVFGLGTAWFGIGVGRGAMISLVHTVVLTVYYWTLSPIGLPSHPNWLDLEHTWLTGVPVHFSVIYLGYLFSLWLYRRPGPDRLSYSWSQVGTAALVTGASIVLLAAGGVWLALGEFPGVTWMVVRLLVTVPFLLFWQTTAGRDGDAAVVGGGTLALIWATYGHFLSPEGLPDPPLRILDPAPPPATVEWLSYRDLWLISLPIYAIVMVGVLAAAVWMGTRRTPSAWSTGTVLAPTVLLLGAGLITPSSFAPASASLTASGQVQVEVGDWYRGPFQEGSGQIRVEAVDQGDRVTPLPPHDQVMVEARLEAQGQVYDIRVDEPMIDDPLGRFGTWWGVGTDVEHHGDSGIGTSRLPTIRSRLALFGIGQVAVDGNPIAVAVPVHVMTSEGELEGGARLEMSVGDPDVGALPNLPLGHLRVLWPDYQMTSHDPNPALYTVGGIVLIILLAAAVAACLSQTDRPVERQQLP